jgi:hypothetical protein
MPAKVSNQHEYLTHCLGRPEDNGNLYAISIYKCIVVYLNSFAGGARLAAANQSDQEEIRRLWAIF